ncbi:MAG: single-stranded-DNA-specific exonuclease RecJ [Bacteroidota bacterium]|nr:single-stranded-DNA-specific exonuclease RecJ [Bacteroidota bacterium]
MRYRWNLLEHSPEDIEAARSLSQSINVPESIASILISRGIRTFDEAKDFFRPSLEHLHQPSLMSDMDIATRRIRTAIEQNELIAVYGDYDVDGTTSTAMMTLFLRSIGANVAYHIPNRFTEGYGLTISSLDRLFNDTQGKPSLLVAIDCGITAIEAVAHARNKGVDVVICDHHEPTDSLPNANAILNPIKKGCGYPYKHLCGCGVAFKLIESLADSHGNKSAAYEYLDFVALASSADIVSLRGENRILVYFGLKLLNEKPRPGIKALIDGAGLKQGKIMTTQIVFGLAPRINAAGRLGEGSRSVELLMAQTQQEALQSAAILELENINRRKIDEEAFFEAVSLVDEMLNRERDRIIVLHNATWHAGVIGIVASRLVERYHLPVVLMTTIDGMAKGSARSIIGFDIHSALKRCEDKLVTFGGHKYAAGVSMLPDRVAEFREAINLVANEMVSDTMLQRELIIDASIDLNELTPKYFAVIRQLAPFGPDNMRPLFYAKDVQVVGTPRIVGKGIPHLKANLRSRKKIDYEIFKANRTDTNPNTIPFNLGGNPIDAIGFGLGTRIDELKGDRGKLREDIEMVFALDENEYNGRTTPQLVIKDFR